MPRGEEIFSKLNGAKYFSTLDLQVGYHHIPLDESLIPKTAFTQAPAYCQELIIGVLKDFPFAIAYLDDIIIFSRTAEEHLYHKRHVFLRNY